MNMEEFNKIKDFVDAMLLIEGIIDEAYSYRITKSLYDDRH